MTRSETIQKLSTELAEILEKNDKKEIIEQFIKAALVSEMERSPGKQLRIYQKIDMNNGELLQEYWGMKEIFEIEKFSNKFITVQRAIDKACSGERHSAYGFLWKRL